MRGCARSGNRRRSPPSPPPPLVHLQEELDDSLCDHLVVGPELATFVRRPLARLDRLVVFALLVVDGWEADPKGEERRPERKEAGGGEINLCDVAR